MDRSTFNDRLEVLENYGATRRDRTGDLLITKPHVSSPMCSYFSQKRGVFRPVLASMRPLITVENK